MEKLKIPVETYVRTAVFALGIINAILTARGYGILPITDEQIEQLVSDLFLICSGLWAYWKNNSVTQAGLRGDKLTKEIKRGKHK